MHKVLLFPIAMLLRLLVLYWSLAWGEVAGKSVVEPVRYNLTILTHLAGGGAQHRYEGIVSIDLAVKKATRKFHLRAFDMKLFLHKTWLVRWASGKRINVIAMKRKPISNRRVLLIVKDNLHAGEAYTLHMFFTGELNSSQRNGYFSGHYDRTPQVFYALTRLEPDYAHTVFPCFDLAKFRTPFNVTLVHHERFVALSNMPAIRETPHAEMADFVWTTFMQTPPMATYQVMWALHQLDKVATGLTASGEMVNVWARPKMKEKLAQVANLTPSLLSSFESLFGYPLRRDPDWGGKWDHLVLPDYTEVDSGKGLLVYGEDEVVDSRLQDMLAEQLARQWLGVMVATSDLDKLYVRDGINYYLAFQLAAMQNKTGHNMTHLLESRLEVMSYDSLPETKALSSNVKSQSPSNKMFRKHKIALITHMLKAAFGDKIFLEGLRGFFESYANTSASVDQLLEEWQRAARRRYQLPVAVALSTLMDTWLRQPGYPMLTVLRDDLNDKVTITQNRYQQNDMDVYSKDCWWLPVMYITESQKLAQVEWMGCQNKNKKDELTLTKVVHSNEWLLLNVDAAVPVRVLYDLHGWRLIADALVTQFTQIPELSRAQLVDDALGMAWVGQMHYNTTLNVIKYLANETSVLVWETALIHLEKLQSVMKMSTGYRVFKYEVKECLADAQEKFKAAMGQKSISSIPEGVQEMVLCKGIRHGVEDDWLMVRNMFFEAKEEEEKAILLNSLSCTTEYWAMQKLFRWSLDRNKVPKALTLGLLAALMRTYLGYYMGHQFLTDNIGEILSRFSSNELKSILKPFVNAVTSKEELATLKSLLQKKLPSSMTSSINSMLDPATKRIIWRKFLYFDLLNAIRNNVQ
ncbi:hypothetical protein M5D96_005440 [Drosophila gunungcola]|uniref:Aminopeptidase n=1 Tax=Drosophila gunungcola TaxID=103775 RepID=A0A9P9YQE7_9MUSC|nr:hypothetical protein M5D96_005440 [Drosophila gunungcola]